MINVSGETPSARCMNTDLIKSVVAGDWVTGREVYKRPSKFKPYAKHYLGMNTLPEIEDNTHGMWRRIYVIEFPYKFSESEADVELTGKLLDELSGIFNWALEGYRRLRDQDFIFSKSPSMEKSKSRFNRRTAVWSILLNHILLKYSTVKILLCLKMYFNNTGNFVQMKVLNERFRKKTSVRRLFQKAIELKTRPSMLIS